MAITRNTVLILGAGASSPYGFPLGVGLRDRVARLTTQAGFRYRLDEFGYGSHAVREFGDAVQHAGYATIDALLEAMPNFVPIGKLAIALALLPLENHASMFPPRVRSNAHWYELLVNRLDVGKPSWIQNNLTIATFNYDRSLEHYLVTVIAEREQLSPSRAARRAAKIKVIHLHGQLGVHPGFGTKPVEYGDFDSEALARASEGIRVVSENNDLSMFKQAGEAISKASQVSFLGFGFAEQSMGRLEMFSKDTSARFSGTSKGLTDSEWLRVVQGYYSRKWVPRRFRCSVFEFIRTAGH